MPLNIEPVRILQNGSDGTFCWTHARSASIPGGTAVMTAQRLLLTGSDVFYAIHSSVSRDSGKSWAVLTEQEPFRRILKEPGNPNSKEAVFCNGVPVYYAAAGKVLMTGSIAFYERNRITKKYFPLIERIPVGEAETHIWYSVFDTETEKWSVPRFLTVPKMSAGAGGGAGCVQRYDLSDGTTLIPVVSKSRFSGCSRVTVLRCAFDSENLFWIGEGKPLEHPVPRGFGEPSVIRLGDRFVLALRNDKCGYAAVSRDGLNFEEPVPLRWESGEEIGNYNTQQHWLPLDGKLYLVYTRRAENNGHVFRHRAPLFIAEFDIDQMALKRETEQITVPERGARLGNFGTTSVSDREGWVVVSEWMQSPRGGGKEGYDDCVSHGADGSIWLSRITVS